MAFSLSFMVFAPIHSSLSIMILVPDTAPAAARRILSLLASAAPAARAGLASCPGDGCDVTSLLASARAAAGGPGAERINAAARAYQEVRLGERTALVADPAMSRL